MTDFNITINDNLRVFGLGPVSKWGDAEFASSPADINVTTNVMWGSNRILFSIEKAIVEAVSFNTSSNSFEVDKVLNDSISISNGQKFTYEKVYGFIMNMSTDMTDLYRLSGDYYYQFPSGTKDGNDQVISTYAKVGSPTNSYSAYSTSGVTWSTV